MLGGNGGAKLAAGACGDDRIVALRPSGSGRCPTYTGTLAAVALAPMNLSLSAGLLIRRPVLDGGDGVLGEWQMQLDPARRICHLGEVLLRVVMARRDNRVLL